MKKRLLSLSICSLLVGAGLTGCGGTTEAVKYTVTALEGTGYSVTNLSATEAEAGETVTFKVELSGNYEVEEVTANSFVVGQSSGVYSFAMPSADVTISVSVYDTTATREAEERDAKLEASLASLAEGYVLHSTQAQYYATTDESSSTGYATKYYEGTGGLIGRLEGGADGTKVHVYGSVATDSEGNESYEWLKSYAYFADIGTEEGELILDEKYNEIQDYVYTLSLDAQTNEVTKNYASRTSGNYTYHYSFDYYCGSNPFGVLHASQFEYDEDDGVYYFDATVAKHIIGGDVNYYSTYYLNTPIAGGYLSLNEDGSIDAIEIYTYRYSYSLKDDEGNNLYDQYFFLYDVLESGEDAFAADDAAYHPVESSTDVSALATALENLGDNFTVTAVSKATSTNRLYYYTENALFIDKTAASTETNIENGNTYYVVNDSSTIDAYVYSTSTTTWAKTETEYTSVLDDLGTQLGSCSAEFYEVSEDGGYDLNVDLLDNTTVGTAYGYIASYVDLSVLSLAYTYNYYELTPSALNITLTEAGALDTVTVTCSTYTYTLSFSNIGSTSIPEDVTSAISALSSSSTTEE